MPKDVKTKKCTVQDTEDVKKKDDFVLNCSG